MHFLTTDEFSQLDGMTMYKDAYAYFAYEGSCLEPTADELVQMHYSVLPFFVSP